MIKKNVKAQSVIEFITLIGAAMFFFTLLLLSVNYKISENNYEDEDLRIRKIALEIQNELSLAKGATDGYKRTFYIPDKINGNNYIFNHYKDEKTISFKTDRISASYQVVEVNEGILLPGYNLVEKINGIIKISEGSPPVLSPPIVCGNSVIETGETCDDGAQNGQPNKCNLLCTGITTPICGNSVIEAGEECDDGNTISGDECSSICEIEIILSPPGNCGNVTGSGGILYNETLDEGICGVECSPPSWIFKSNFCKSLNYGPKKDYCYQGSNSISICVECIIDFNCQGNKICNANKICVNP